MEGNAENGGNRDGNRWRIAVWGVAALVLLLQLVGTVVSEAINWGLGDFAIAGALLLGIGVAYELVVRWKGNRGYRAGAGVALAAAFGLVWLSVGVGIIGRDGDPANLIFFGVLAAGIFGAVIGRFRPAGMARALLVTAVAQVLAAATALAAGWGTESTNWPLDILGLTGGFTALWLVAAGLFRKAAGG